MADRLPIKHVGDEWWVMDQHGLLIVAVFLTREDVERAACRSPGQNWSGRSRRLDRAEYPRLFWGESPGRTLTEMSAKKFTDAQLEKALRKACGIKSHAAEKLGVSRQSVQVRVDGSPHLQAVLAEIDETVLDMVDGIILRDLKAKDSATARWMAERKGKKRGYGTKLEIGLSEADLAAVVAAVGGDLEGLKRLRASVAAHTSADT